MAQIEFNCPHCGAVVNAEESMRGQVAECPSCAKGIVIPRAASPAPQGKSIVVEKAASGILPTQDPPASPHLVEAQRSGAVPRAQTHYESMMETEAKRRRKEKMLDALLFVVKTIAAIVFICVAAWVTKTTWAKMKNAEQQQILSEREADAERRIKQLEGDVAAANKNVEKLRESAKDEHLRMENAKSEHAKELEDLRRSNRDELDKLKESHRAEIAELKAAYEKRLAEIAIRKESSEEEGQRREPRRMVRCSRCSGKGEIQKKVRCVHCGGSGRIKETTKRWVGGDYYRSSREKLSTTFSDCPYCLPGAMRGSGSKGYTIETETCPKCDGKGKVPLD